MAPALVVTDIHIFLFLLIHEDEDESKSAVLASGLSPEELSATQVLRQQRVSVRLTASGLSRRAQSVLWHQLQLAGVVLWHQLQLAGVVDHRVLRQERGAGLSALPVLPAGPVLAADGGPEIRPLGSTGSHVVGDKFLRDQALLEEQLGSDVKGLDTAAAIRKACIDICQEKLDTDPEGASLYARAILSWDPSMDSAWSTGWPLRDEIQDGLKEAMDQLRKTKEGFSYTGASRRIGTRLAKLKPEEIRGMAADACVVLNNRGYNLPAPELSAALGASVRIQKERAAQKRRWKDAAVVATTALSVVASVVSTVHTLKDISQDQNEPLLSCRHYLPLGWFFE